ncbi:hypothetical protein [Allostreptomyces psammosilenae]|uniref:SPOR domain-containing protein n=1 Tax=Allostreptomyces psammosilenae TaxID=1892865 RepID=A0A853A8Z3_9ACTN|nr:hypothetical protein [Allostreptomyces psammosilenae]NYI06892.1 hypothetical protein [Allostreptomyces psammosilenae]
MARNEKATGAAGTWYYCLKHHTVEEGPECSARNRLGPYASRESAGKALEVAAERDEAWETDPRWRDDR